MSAEKIIMEESELRGLGWLEDSRPETYHVERDEADDDKLCVVSDGDADAYYGATASLPDGRNLTVCEDWSGESATYVDGEPVALTVVDVDGWEIIPDWSDITGYNCNAPMTDDDTWAVRADAVTRFVRNYYDAGGKVYRQDGEFNNVYTCWLCAGETVCGDVVTCLPSGVDVGKLRELDFEAASRAVRFALIGNRYDYYNGASAQLVQGRSYGCEIDTANGETDVTDVDMSHDEAWEMAKCMIADGAWCVRIVDVRCDYIVEQGRWHKSEPKVVAVINNSRV